MKNSRIKNLVMAALCLALGVVLPFALHAVPNAGSVILPMHIPVLLCGLVCGWRYGLLCGILAPVLSSVLTGMPPMAYVPSMLFELATYGLVAGLLSARVRTGRRTLDLYICLIAAMLAGRAVFGVLNALVFMPGNYAFSVFVTAAFVTALPGIVIQLVLLPAVVRLLERANLVGSAYKGEQSA